MLKIHYFREKISMKPIFKEFYCRRCRKLRYISVNGICYDCRNEKNLETLTIKRKRHIKLNGLYHSLVIER
jgi:hypothetical protein